MRLARHAKVLVPFLLLGFAACGSDDDTGLFGGTAGGASGGAAAGASGSGRGGSAGGSVGGSTAGGSSAGGKGGQGGGTSKGGSAGGTSKGGAAGQGTAGEAGSAGTGGSAGQGSAGKGGTNAGGTSAGGANAGGTSAGGTSAGGANAGGTQAGGTSAGGTNAGGTSAGGTQAGGSNAGGANAGGTNAGGTNAGGTSAGGTNAGGSSAGGTSAGGGGQGGSTCTQPDRLLTMVKRPVDLVMVIDNSGSMTDEIEAVQKSLYDDLVAPLASAKLDWRFLLVARHGSATAAQSVCVSKPLSGHDCAPIPATPTSTPTFLHYSVEIGSVNGLQQLVATYEKPDEFNLAPSGWRPFVRQAARSVLIMVTDDNTPANVTAQSITQQLLSLPGEPFGRPEAPDFAFHSLIGVRAKPNDPSLTYAPSEPVVSTRCISAVNTGGVYQALSKDTQGLRAPICELAQFPKFFGAIAKNTIDTTPLRCDVEPPPGSGIVPSSVAQLRFSGSTNAEPEVWNRVASLEACTPSSFVADAESFRLCPGACQKARSDEAATLAIVEPCP